MGATSHTRSTIGTCLLLLATVPDVASASVLRGFEFLGSLADGRDLGLELVYAQRQRPIEVDGDICCFPITFTFQLRSVGLRVAGDVVGRVDGGRLVERDGGGRLPDAFGIESQPLAGGPWITMVLQYAVSDDDFIDRRFPVDPLLISPYITDTLSFDGRIGVFRLRRDPGGPVLRGQLSEVRAFVASIGEPMTLALAAAGLFGVGALARWRAGVGGVPTALLQPKPERRAG